jgi:hypothetical protein
MLVRGAHGQASSCPVAERIVNRNQLPELKRSAWFPVDVSMTSRLAAMYRGQPQTAGMSPNTAYSGAGQIADNFWDFEEVPDVSGVQEGHVAASLDASGAYVVEHAGHRISPVSNSTSMTNWNVTSSAPTQSFFIGGAPGSDLSGC